MAHATLKMNGKEFVLVPKAEFRKLAGRKPRNGTRTVSPPLSTRSRREASDVTEARRRLAEGNFKPYSQLRKGLGLE